MVIPVPTQGYIESLVQSIREEGLVYERLCQLLFAVIDEFWDGSSIRDTCERYLRLRQPHG